MPLYRNSENTVEFKYARFLQPKTEEELIHLLQESRAEGRKVKASGGHNTFNHIKKTADTMVDLSRLPEFSQLISVDTGNKTAVIGGGMIVADAIDALNKHGLHFPVLGGWFTQTIGGAMATSTHGSSFAHGSLSDLVLEIEAILSDGSRVRMTEQDEAMKAWRVSLGQLGIITRVKVKLTDAFYLRCGYEDVEDDRVGFDSLFRRIERWDSPGESPYVSLLWLPYSGEQGRTLTRTLHRTSAGRPNQEAIDYEERWARRDGSLAKNVAEDRGSVLLAKSFIRTPHLYKSLWSNAMANAYLDDKDSIDRSFRPFSYEQFREVTENHWLRLVLSTEIAIDASQLESVISDLRKLLRENLDRRIVANFPRFHIRFANESHGSWLGMNAGRRTAYFNMYFSAAVLRSRQIPLAIAMEKILDAHGGRPHWGKFRHLGQDEKFIATYGDSFSRFESYRAAVDPTGMFSDGWRMFKDLEMFDEDDLFVAPFSGMNPDNYQKMRFLGGRSSDIE